MTGFGALSDRKSLGASVVLEGYSEPDFKGIKEPVLVSSIDGVGTKLKIAIALGKHATVAQDLVNHCINDIAVTGARPLFFLDYIGAGRLDPAVFNQLISGFTKACKAGGCALIGGETAQLPDLYRARGVRSCGLHRRVGGSSEDVGWKPDRTLRSFDRVAVEWAAHKWVHFGAKGFVRKDAVGSP